MRKIILVATMVLVSASAQAGGPRSLSLSSTSEPASVQQTAPALAAAPTQVSEAAPAAEAPKYLDRPPAVSLTAPAAAPPPGDHDARRAGDDGPTRREDGGQGRQAEAQAQLDRRPHHR